MTANKFARQDAIRITKTSSAELSYLERKFGFAPLRIGETKKPICLFSYRQLLIIKAWQAFKKQISPDIKVIAIQKLMNSDGQKDDAPLVILEGCPYWLDELCFQSHLETGKINQPSIVIIPPLASFAATLDEDHDASRSPPTDKPRGKP